LWVLVALGGVPSAVLGRALLVPFFGSSSGVSRPQGKGPSAEERQASAERARLERELASFRRTETYSAEHEIADEADLDEWDEADFSVPSGMDEDEAAEAEARAVAAEERRLEMRRERNDFNEKVAKAQEEVAKADYHKLMHEYKHGRMADGDARQSNAVMHAIAPEHHREYFKHVDELARVGASKESLERTTVLDDWGNPRTVHAHRLSEEQHAALPRSTREYIRHQHKTIEEPEKVARWEALNARAARTNWLGKNEKARERGFHVDDRVSRRIIGGR